MPDHKVGDGHAIIICTEAARNTWTRALEALRIKYDAFNEQNGHTAAAVLVVPKTSDKTVDDSWLGKADDDGELGRKEVSSSPFFTLEDYHPALETTFDTIQSRAHNSFGSIRSTVSQLTPKYVAVLALPSEIDRGFVATLTALFRFRGDEELGGSPPPSSSPSTSSFSSFTDAIWGIVTGIDEEEALKMIWTTRDTAGPLESVGSGTELALEHCGPGSQFYDELKEGKHCIRGAGNEIIECEVGSRSLQEGYTQEVAEMVAKSDCFVSSGHGSERSWMLGFKYKNGFIISGGGPQLRMGGLVGDTDRCGPGELRLVNKYGKVFDFPSEGKVVEKVWLPVGNCSVGHLGQAPVEDSFMLAMMKTAKVRAAIGYTVPTWFGYAGWGLLDYFIEQPGRYTLAEAVCSNRVSMDYIRMQQRRQQSTIAASSRSIEAESAHHLERNRGPLQNVVGESLLRAAQSAGIYSAQYQQGILHDRAVLAFYGDPTATFRTMKGPTDDSSARPSRFEQSTHYEENSGTLSFKAKGDFTTVNKNGSERGHRHIVWFSPLSTPLLKGRSLTITKVLGTTLEEVVVRPWYVCVPRPAFATAASIEVDITLTPGAQLSHEGEDRSPDTVIRQKRGRSPTQADNDGESSAK